MTQSERFTVLDSWRGIAALGVAAFHFNTTGHAQHFPLVRHAWLFVDFFFVLSGFVISHAYFTRLTDRAQLQRFAILRFGRLYPLHAFILVVYAASELFKLIAAAHGIAQFDRPAFSHENSPETLLANILMIHGLGLFHMLTWNGPSWSISDEFFAYLIFGAVIVYAVRPKLWFLAAIIGSFGVLAAFSPRYIDATMNFGFFRCLLGFFTGHFVWTAYRWVCATPGRIQRMQSLAPALELITLALALAFIFVVDGQALNLAAPLVFASLVFVYAFEAGLISRLLSRDLFQRMGRLSYSFYMIHFWIRWVFTMIVTVVLAKVVHARLATWTGANYQLGTSPLSGDLWLVIYLATVIGLSHLTYRYVEEPGRRFFKALADRMTPSPAGRAPQPVRSEV